MPGRSHWVFSLAPFWILKHLSPRPPSVPNLAIQTVK
jgi:hypothetical protein